MEENLQEKSEEKRGVPVEGGDTCGGKPYPPNPVGEVGEWICDNGTPKWIPAT